MRISAGECNVLLRNDFLLSVYGLTETLYVNIHRGPLLNQYDGLCAAIG